MRIALPVWNGRISPVFDSARRLLLVDTAEAGGAHASEETLEEIVPLARVKRLSVLGADVLICAGISPAMLSALSACGIRVIPGIAGDAMDVVKAFRSGRFPAPQFFMPGWRGGRRRRFRRGRPFNRGGD